MSGTILFSHKDNSVPLATKTDERPFIWALIASCVICSFCRIPELLNAECIFNSDEAVSFLSLAHAIDGSLPTLLQWGQSYIGFSQNILVFPLLLLFGWKAWIIKLSAALGLLASIATAGLLSRRVFGMRAGIVTLILASVLGTRGGLGAVGAGAGYSFIGCCGLIACWLLAKAIRFSSIKYAALAGLICGYFLYAHLHMLFWFAPIAVCLFLWSTYGISKSDQLPKRMAVTAAFLVTTGISYSPHFVAFQPPSPVDDNGSKYMHLPPHAHPEQRLRYVRQGIEDACGVMYPGTFVDVPRGTRVVSDLASKLETALLLLSLPATLLFLTQNRKSLVHYTSKSDASLEADKQHESAMTFLFLLLSVASTDLILCLVSGNYYSASNSRYLLPLVWAALVCLGSLTREGARYGNLFSFVVVLSALVQLITQVMIYPKEYSTLHPASPEPLNQVIAFLRKNNVQVGYADFWVAYKMDFLGHENPLIASYPYATCNTNRSISFNRRVDSNSPRAYVFQENDQAIARFQTELTKARAHYTEHLVDGYKIFVTADKLLDTQPNKSH